MSVGPGDTAVARRVSVPQASQGTPVLVVLGPHGAPPSATVLSAPLLIGRDAGCDLVLQDEAASRAHVRLVPVEGGVEVRDLGSSNGTLLDGQPVTSAVAACGSWLRVGDTLLRLTRLTEGFVPASPEGPLVGGTALSALRRTIGLVAPTELPTLVLGETGTGKDVVARLIHEGSGRSGPFIAVNCAALPAALVESELFGHVRGAFTGAGQARKGLFAAASGGTLFLDEVGELPAEAQAKLLRVLEDGVVRAVGSEQAMHVDVRVVSATNRDVAAWTHEGQFRGDLLARLAAVELRLPPLRERPEDIPALAAYLLARALGKSIPIDANALEALLLYDWPLNVRELDSVLRSSVLGGVMDITFERLPERLRRALASARSAAPAANLPTTPPGVPESQRDRLERALRESGGNVRQASREMGLSRAHVYRLLDRWEMDPNQYRVRTRKGRSAS